MNKLSPKKHVGKRFGKLVVIRFSHMVKTNSFWVCSCECGGEITTTINTLNKGKATSCGCVRLMKITTHGLSDTPEWRCWASMRYRCNNPSLKQYKNYGGRGIKVCERWNNSFERFLEDMGKRPSPKHSIDRIDNNGDYEPKNCRWATQKQQANNVRTNHVLEFKGESMTLTRWARKIELHPNTLLSRIRKGWSVERALTTPVNGA